MAKPTDLQTRFTKEIVSQLKEKLGKKNTMAIPKITKVKINVGMGS